MLKLLSDKNDLVAAEKKTRNYFSLAAPVVAGLLGILVGVAGCASSPPAKSSKAHAVPVSTASTNEVSTNESKSLVLQEGDTIKIAFPGAPNMDSTQVVRRDGKVSLEMIGEYIAAGKTPSTMEKELKDLYKSQLVNNEVSVTVVQSAFVVYVMGAVQKPGKVISERPLDILEALIEGGIDSSRSDLKHVQVLRKDAAGHTETFKLNLQKVLKGNTKQMPDFTLKPYDIINVPERFSWF